MKVTINDSESGLARAEKLLAGITGGYQSAVRSAMRRTVAFVNTESAKRIQEHYAISRADLKASGRVVVQYQTSNGLTAHVIFNGHKIPLYKFQGSGPKGAVYDTGRRVPVPLRGEAAVRWILAHPGFGARGHILKSTGPVKFDNAFVAKVGSGDHVGIFERTGGTASSGSDAIREIMGLSNAQMIGNEEVIENLSEDAARKFDERMDHEIARILGGFGR